MKIVTDEHCFVNKIDIATLIYYKIEIPKEIFDETFPNGLPIVTEFNEYDFIEIDTEKYKKFSSAIKNADWIIDIQDLNNAHSRELLEVYKGYEIQRRLIVKRFNGMEYQEKRKNYGMKKRYDLLEYKMKAIGDYLYYRLGQIDIEIPEVVKNNVISKSKAKKITNLIFRNKKLT